MWGRQRCSPPSVRSIPSHTGFELREAYLDYHDTHWSMRAGRQLILWGVADAVRITDLIAPMDYTEFLAQDYDDIRMPVNALRLGFFNEKVRLDLVAVPTFTPFRLPIDTSNPWSVLCGREETSQPYVSRM